MSAKYNLVCDQATTFNFQFQIKNDNTPWDLTGYSGVMTIKPFSNSTTTTLVASTSNGSMAFDVVNGRINVIFTATQTNREGFANTDPDLTNTSESFGLPMTADFMFALISTDELEEAKKTLPTTVPSIFISSAANFHIDKLKDLIWKMLNDTV